MKSMFDTRRPTGRNAPRRRLPAGAAPLLAVVIVMGLAVLGGIVQAFGSGGPTASAAPTRLATVVYHAGDDWRHVGQAVVYYHRRPGGRPFVYLFGGSAARECTISDSSWRAQITSAGGPATTALNLGSAGQTYDQDIEAVALLPRRPTIVYIGVNLGRYTHGRPGSYGDRMASSIKKAEQVDPPVISPYTQHRFAVPQILSPAKKRSLAAAWMANKYPIFKRQFDYNAGRLQALVKACQAAGFHPVLLNLPFDLGTIGHTLDKPRARYGNDCRATAKALGVPYYDFNPTLGLVDRDFFDNWHLVQSGRVKWQRKLTSVTLALFARYGIGVGSPSPSGSPSASPSGPSPEPSSAPPAPAPSGSTSAS
jgi:hypothetical protein